MAKAEKTASTRSLRGDFKGVTVIRSESGDLTFDVSALGDVNVTIITNGDGEVTELTLAEAQKKNQEGNGDVTQSGPTAVAFNPANAVVKAGQVQLNKLSKYLSDLPDNAVAELLVAPKDTARIFERNIGGFIGDIIRIRNIGKGHGIHHEGQALTGMQIFDRPDNAKDVTYEQAWAVEVKAAWKQANEFGKTVITTLAIGTKQIVNGQEIGTRDITVANNLYSKVGSINAALKEQGGQQIIVSYHAGNAGWQLTASEQPGYRSNVCGVNTFGEAHWSSKDTPLSSRPVALEIAPASP